MKPETIGTILGFILVAIVMFVVGLVITVIPILLLRWAWNSVLADLFNFPMITFWQAVGVSVLLSFLRSTVSIVTRTKT